VSLSQFCCCNDAAADVDDDDEWTELKFGEKSTIFLSVAVTMFP
jgi:hypothetical protein